MPEEEVVVIGPDGEELSAEDAQVFLTKLQAGVLYLPQA